MSSPEAVLDALRAVLRVTRLTMRDEDKMQETLFLAMQRAGLDPSREVRLGDAGRIDFTLPTDGLLIGLELKTRSGANAHARQLIRYGLTRRFAMLVMVTTRPFTLPISEVKLDDAPPVPIHLIHTAFDSL